MRQHDKPSLFVVDGSNIATEGRSKPSLEQLNEAVAAFREEYPGVKVTVVVDATFGHRIATKEVKGFDKAVAANELVTPPAGAVGRGDAFILAIADKAKAGVFSNDSFQEFHGDYEWLFEPGRLIGGKPVPHVGWVFVDRNPVRGRRSRESVKAAKRTDVPVGSPTEAKEQAQRRVRKKSAALPADGDQAMSATPESVTPPDAATPERSPRRRGPKPAAAPPDPPRSPSPSRAGQVNDPAAFFDFVERHPVGTTVRARVDSYASHGAYAESGDVRVYLPLRLMGDPAPTSARKVLKLGDEIDVVVAAFVPDRLSIDAALASHPAAEPIVDQTAASVSRSGAKKAAKQPAVKKPAAKKPAAKKAPAKQPAAKKPAAPKPAKKPAAAKSAAKQAAAERPARKAPAKGAAARKPAAKKAAAKKAAARGRGRTGADA